jgi:hypothetical protein
MFEPDAELAAMLAADDAVRAGLPADEPPAWLLDSLPAAELSPAQWIDRLVALERQLARVHAEQVSVLAAIDRADTSKERWSQEAVMCALKVSANAAQTRLKTARTLTDDLPFTLAALSDGSFSGRHAETIAEAAWRLPADVHAEFETLALDRAAEQSLPELRRAVKAAAIRVDPATSQARQARARDDRCLRTTPAEKGWPNCG